MGKEPAYYKEIIHNSKRRAPWHDYHSRCIYMVTVTKMPGVPIFGTVMNVNNPKKAFIKLTEIGKIICEEITATPSRNTAIRILEHIVMPDHFHILLYISQPIATIGCTQSSSRVFHTGQYAKNRRGNLFGLWQFSIT